MLDDGIMGWHFGEDKLSDSSKIQNRLITLLYAAVCQLPGACSSTNPNAPRQKKKSRWPGSTGVR